MEAYSLAKLASTLNSKLTRTIPVQYLNSAKIDEPVREVLPISVHNELTWMDPIIWYLESGELSEDKAEARRLRY